MAGENTHENYSAILEEHKALKAQLAEVEAVLGDGGCSAARLTELLTKLREQLNAHFSAEVKDGYFAKALAKAPHLARHAQELEAQHPVIAGKLESLFAAAKGQDFRTRAHQGFIEFRDAFMAHEEAENDLLLRAYEQDVGGAG